VFGCLSCTLLEYFLSFRLYVFCVAAAWHAGSHSYCCEPWRKVAGETWQEEGAGQGHEFANFLLRHLLLSVGIFFC
jgi:hypothetical protein